MGKGVGGARLAKSWRGPGKALSWGGHGKEAAAPPAVSLLSRLRRGGPQLLTCRGLLRRTLHPQILCRGSLLRWH